MDYYTTIQDINSSQPIALLQSVSLSFPLFFPLAIFVFWIVLIAASYFSIFKTTGSKRFWQSTTALSFIMVLFSLLLANMNSSTATIISGYWVGFYILMTLGSWFALSQYR